MLVFVTWCFSRCHAERRIVYHIQKAVELDPFEFIFGRKMCSIETGLTEDEVRSCIAQLNWENQHCNPQQKPENDRALLQKSTSKTTNKYTVYKWSTDIFNESYPQQNPQQNPQQSPSRAPQQRTKIVEFQKEQQQQKEETVVAVFPCLKNLGLSEEDVSTLMKYPEERILLAIEFNKHEPAKKTLIAQLLWHCKANKPPIAKKIEAKSEQQIEAEKFNEKYKYIIQKDIYEKNIDSIPQNTYTIWLGGRYVPISLKNNIKEIRKDFSESANTLNHRSAN